MAETDERTLTPLSFVDVTIDDSFWSPRLETLRSVTLDVVYESLTETGRIDNFRKAADRQDGDFAGFFYNDSDVYKWLEAACYQFARAEDPALEARIDTVVDAIESAQEDDGYLNTYFTLVEPEKKWTNLHSMHELYCAGHLIEAAIAHHRATGERRLLAVGSRLADHVDDVFGPDGMRGYPGHEEIELALVALYRETDEQRYLDLARYFIDERGVGPSRFEWEVDNIDQIAGELCGPAVSDGRYDPTYLQDHAPVREQTTAEGHAVRATYLYAGMADLAIETGEQSLQEALERIWSNMVTRRMYVTGGIGSTHEGERFTEDFDLPNETSYAETCASLGSIRWNQRMLRLTGEGRFGDVLERTLYNGLLAGLSLSGDRFFYANPLEINGTEHALRDANEHRFANQRQPWFSTACCPTNVPRLLLSLGRHVYFRRADPDCLLVNLYLGSRAETTVAGTDVVVSQETDYPWDGTVRIDVDPATAVEFTLQLRVPEWCESHTLAVDGETVSTSPEDGFVAIERTWSPDSSVTLDLELDVLRLCSHPAVRENDDRVALQRGPLVYCLEGVDHDRPLADYVLAPELNAEASSEPGLLDGVTTITGDALVDDRSTWEGLYRSVEDISPDDEQFRAVPYYGWGHREPGELRVWIRSHALPDANRNNSSTTN